MGDGSDGGVMDDGSETCTSGRWTSGTPIGAVVAALVAVSVAVVVPAGVAVTVGVVVGVEVAVSVIVAVGVEVAVSGGVSIDVAVKVAVGVAVAVGVTVGADVSVITSVTDAVPVSSGTPGSARTTLTALATMSHPSMRAKMNSVTMIRGEGMAGTLSTNRETT